MHSRGPFHVDCQLAAVVHKLRHHIDKPKVAAGAGSLWAVTCLYLPRAVPWEPCRVSRVQIAAVMRLAPAVLLALAGLAAVVGPAAGAAWKRGQTLTDSSVPWWVTFESQWHHS